MLLPRIQFAGGRVEEEQKRGIVGDAPLLHETPVLWRLRNPADLKHGPAFQHPRQHASLLLGDDPVGKSVYQLVVRNDVAELNASRHRLKKASLRSSVGGNLFALKKCAAMHTNENGLCVGWRPRSHRIRLRT